MPESSRPAQCGPFASSPGRALLVCGLAALLPLVSATLAGADWLVTRDGSRIETRGSWSERGELIVFSLENGTLASLRRSQVDLEASRAATAKAAEAAERSRDESDDAPPRKSVLVLTDEDVGHSSSTAQPSTSESGVETSEPGPGSEQEPLQVVSWREGERDDGLGVIVTGTARNGGGAVASALSLSVTLYDPEGEVVATSSSLMGADALAPGQSTSFRAEFPGVFSFAGVGFDFGYQPIQTATTPPEAQATQREEPE